jgi:hypothetical protein
MKRWQQQLARRFDGEGAEVSETQTPEERAYLAALERLRTGARAVATRAEIRDAQLPAFLHGIREGIQTPPSYRRVWALLSLSTAALLVALSAFLVFTWRNDDAASVVEAASTQIQGATVSSYSQEDGTAVVWVRVPRRDLP